MTKLQQNMA